MGLVETQKIRVPVIWSKFSLHFTFNKPDNRSLLTHCYFHFQSITRGLTILGMQLFSLSFKYFYTAIFFCEESSEIIADISCFAIIL